MATIVFSTFGSLGDVYPYLAIGRVLQGRGHRVVIAANGPHRRGVEAAGFAFVALQPELPPGDRELLSLNLDTARGTERLFREYFLPTIRTTYDELTAAIRGADLLVSHPLTLAAPLVAEQTGIRWLSSVLAPTSLFSAYDPPILAPFPELSAALRGWGPLVNGVFLGLGKFVTEPWLAPLRALRAELGLGWGGNPLFEGQFSPRGTLALFSGLMGSPQPDWPPHTHPTGFCFWDDQELPEDLEAFLAAGEPPIVFTLGSAAVFVAQDFFIQSAAAVRRLNRRAVLVVGDNPGAGLVDERIAVVPYAPHGKLFSRAAAVVHQGGIGTSAQALRAGVPMLVVPFNFDQPDNAERLARLGVARTLTRPDYCAARVATELEILLNDKTIRARAADAGRRVRSENGAVAAADRIEAALCKPS